MNRAMSIISQIEALTEEKTPDIIMNENGVTFVCEADMYFHDVFDAVMEARTIPEKERKDLPDTSFGLIYKDEDGKQKRSYPLIVPDDIEKSKELQQKAVGMFHFCKPEYKKKLAVAIVDAIASSKTGVKIGANNQIHVYCKVPKEFIGEEVKIKK